MLHVLRHKELGHVACVWNDEATKPDQVAFNLQGEALIVYMDTLNGRVSWRFACCGCGEWVGGKDISVESKLRSAAILTRHGFKVPEHLAA